MDPCKDGGILASSWNLYQAQQKVIALADDRHVACRLFHGRGGTIRARRRPNSRGDPGPARGHGARADQVHRQGEVLSYRYATGRPPATS